MPVTVLDIIVVVVVLISAILAMVRGFVREVLSVASWVAAAAAAYFFYKPVVPYVSPYFDSQTVSIVVAAAAIFFVALIIASYITMKIADFVIDSRIGAVDRVLGFIFGAVRGILIVVIALLFFGWLVPHPPNWITAARTKPVLDDLGQRLMAALPEDAEAWITDKLGGDDATGDTGTAGEPPAEGTEPPAAPGEPGTPADPNYDSGGIDNIIENNAGDAGTAEPTDQEGGAPPPAN